MNLKNRWLWFGAIALLAMILLSLFSAPRSSLLQGSTYSRSPDGYGAWFAYMQAQGSPVQRWQQPIDQLIRPSRPNQHPAATEIKALSSAAHPLTLIQINNGFGGFTAKNQAWIEQGNVLVLLGVRAAPTPAPFRSRLASPVGSVRIETSRRLTAQEPESRLSDAYGSVVWEEKLGKGRVIFCSTAFLAANAYQDEPGNFKFLAKLVTEPGQPIWVDEYIHGYQDQAVTRQKTSQSLLQYFSNTPLIVVALQVAITVLVLIWGLNRRLGAPVAWIEPAANNSEAYIQALAGVLQKANCSDFVVETIGKAEQLHLQRSLGLGTDLLEAEALTEAWQRHTGQSAVELQAALDLVQRHSPKNYRPNSQELLTWLRSWQAIRQKLQP
jgi:Domain of unknown function (DUF4350)